ncbi:MAG: ComF family protein [Eubacteriales bacterium]
MNILKKAFEYLFCASYPYCIYCGSETDIDPKTHACKNCKELLVPVGKISEDKNTSLFAVYHFNQPVKDMLHNYKYNGKRYLAREISDIMFSLCLNNNLSADAVTYVPLHKAKLRKRGFDQSQLIAKHLAKKLSLPFETMLVRTVNTKTQTRLNHEERKINVKNAFTAKRPSLPPNILLIDDTVTTGSTAYECAKTLLISGAKQVIVLCFSHPLLT